MLNFRQGNKGWKIQVWNAGVPLKNSDGSIIEFIFPRCNEAGAPEDHTPVTKTKKTIGETRKNKLKGYHITFNFFYERFTPPVVLDRLKAVVDYWQGKEIYENLQLILYPRLDILDRYFPVFPSEETIRIAIMKGADKAKGNKGVVIKFLTIDLIKKLSVADPNDRSLGLINLTTL